MPIQARGRRSARHKSPSHQSFAADDRSDAMAVGIRGAPNRNVSLKSRKKPAEYAIHYPRGACSFGAVAGRRISAAKAPAKASVS